MKKNKWTAWLCQAGMFIALMVMTTVPVWATSPRFLPEDGYAAQLYTMNPGDYEKAQYQGGLDIVYAQVAEGTAAAKTRCIMKIENGSFTNSGDSYNLRLMLYDYTGNAVKPLAFLNHPDSLVWGQAMKLDTNTNTVWFSITNNNNTDDRWYNFSWDESLATYPINLNTASYQTMPCNWEMEVSTDDPAPGGIGGTLFFSGLNDLDWAEPQSIWIRDASQPDGWRRVVEIGGPSCGFAFDNNGNLWSGQYGWGAQNHIFMWDAGQVDYVVTNGGVLNINDYDATTNSNGCKTKVGLPMVQDSYGTWHYAGANDVECAPDGNVYVSANGGFDPVGDTDCGYVVKIVNNGQSPWPTTCSTVGLGSVAASPPGEYNWDWLKALSYDGLTNLEDGGHTDPTVAGPTSEKLYLDHDYYAQEPGEDTVSAITADYDYDNDGVPDAVDNAYQTYTENEIQADTDQDMYGNICDADFNNSDFVGSGDFGIFEANFNQSVPPGNPDADMNSNNWIGPTDFNLFEPRFNTFAPWY